MRILLVSEDVPFPSMGGLAKHALALGRALGRAGHQVDFMGNAEQVFVDGEPELAMPGRFFPELKSTQRGWKEQSLGCFIPFKRDVIARGIARAILLRAADHDVVHYHGHYPNVGAFIPAHINFVQTRHDQGSDCLVHTRFRNGDVCTALDPAECAGCMVNHPNAFQRAVSAITVRAYRRRVAEAFRLHKTVFVSQMLLRNFTRSAGPGPWGSVVHNFIDQAALERAAAAPMRPEDLPADARVIVFAGKLYPAKGIEPLLAGAVPKLAGNTYILVIGDGPQEQLLRGIYASNRVRFLGWCTSEKTLAHMAGADGIVVPSVCEESCATTVLEALALGKPCLALARGGTPELKRYERYPGQLTLCSDMKSLVARLQVSAGGFADNAIPEYFASDVHSALVNIVKIYSLD
jgi:glycosyltransferase involved in cell wall biosynthesis